MTRVSHVCAALFIMSGLSGPGCASHASGNDGETHFLCASTPDCPSGQECVDRQCVPEVEPAPSPLDGLLEGPRDYHLPDLSNNAMNVRFEAATFRFGVTMCDSFGSAEGTVDEQANGELVLRAGEPFTWPVPVDDTVIFRTVEAVRVVALGQDDVTLLVEGREQIWASGSVCALCIEPTGLESCAEPFLGQ